MVTVINFIRNRRRYRNGSQRFRATMELSVFADILGVVFIGSVLALSSDNGIVLGLLGAIGCFAAAGLFAFMAMAGGAGVGPYD